MRKGAGPGSSPLRITDYALRSPLIAMRVAITADLHWGHSPRGDAATRALARRVEELAPELFVIGGDVGEGDRFPRCLALFAALSCPRLVIPGNHDLWTERPAPD